MRLASASRTASQGPIGLANEIVAATTNLATTSVGALVLRLAEMRLPAGLSRPADTFVLGSSTMATASLA